MKTLLNALCLVLLAFTLVATSCTGKNSASTVASFYKGKTITLVVASDAGSAVDLIGRVLADQLARDTGATVVVQNMRGTGGLEGMNYLYKAAPDGLTLGISSAIKLVTNKIMNDPAAEYEFEKYSYIMSIDAPMTYFWVSPRGDYQTVDALKAAKNLNIGGATASGYVTLAGLSIVQLLGLDAKVVTGFADNTARSLATQRGEIAGYAIALSSTVDDVAAGNLKPLFVLATRRDPQNPEVPCITELAQLSPDNLELVQLWETTLVASNLFVAPPGTPDNIVDYLRQFCEKWVQDSAFLQKIDAVAGYHLQTYKTGDAVSQTLTDMAASTSKYQQMFADMIAKYRK